MFPPGLAVPRHRVRDAKKAPGWNQHTIVQYDFNGQVVFQHRRANYGSVLMALACGRGGRVLACEPNPLLAETYLSGNLALDGCRDQVEICQRVIGWRDQERVDFVLHHGDYATSSLERWAYPHRAEAIQVPMATLD